MRFVFYNIVLIKKVYTLKIAKYSGIQSLIESKLLGMESLYAIAMAKTSVNIFSRRLIHPFCAVLIRTVIVFAYAQINGNCEKTEETNLPKFDCLHYLERNKLNRIDL